MKLIIVDDSKDYMSLLRRMLAGVMPDIEVTEYDPEQQGRPSRDFAWDIYDVLLIDYRLSPQEKRYRLDRALSKRAGLSAGDSDDFSRGRVMLRRGL